MGWFDEQIKQRKQSDDQLFEEAFVRMADAVLGSKMSSAFASDEARASNAIGEILKYYKIKPPEIPDSVKGLDDRLEFLLRPHGIMRRNVQLDNGWYKNAVGAMLGKRTDDGSVIALLPRGLNGYAFFDVSSQKWVNIGRKNQHLVDDEAICFYKPFPLKKLTVSSLLQYIAQCLDKTDLFLVMGATLLVTLVGLLLPRLNALLFGPVAASGSARLLMALAMFMVSVSISQLLLRSVNALLTGRIHTKLSLSVQAATMMRVLSLPAEFFKHYSSGELADRAQQIQSLCSMLVSAALNTGLSSLFSLLYQIIAKRNEKGCKGVRKKSEEKA